MSTTERPHEIMSRAETIVGRLKGETYPLFSLRPAIAGFFKDYRKALTNDLLIRQDTNSCLAHTSQKTDDNQFTLPFRRSGYMMIKAALDAKAEDAGPEILKLIAEVEELCPPETPDPLHVPEEMREDVKRVTAEILSRVKEMEQK